MDRWIADTQPTERFPIFTRGNADEVGPDPFTPLNWSLPWEQGVVPGTAWGWIHLGTFKEHEFLWTQPETYGSWGGYFYNQVSVGRVFGHRMPGLTADAIDVSFFGQNPAEQGHGARRGCRDKARRLSQSQTECEIIPRGLCPATCVVPLGDFVAPGVAGLRAAQRFGLAGRIDCRLCDIGPGQAAQRGFELGPTARWADRKDSAFAFDHDGPSFLQGCSH